MKSSFDFWNTIGWILLFVLLIGIGVGVWWTWWTTMEVKDAVEHHYKNSNSDSSKDHYYYDHHNTEPSSSSDSDDSSYHAPPPPPQPYCPPCHCPPPSIHVSAHEEKPCRCENINKIEDALTDFFVGDPWKLYNITDFKRFQVIINAPQFPFGGTFEGREILRFLRRIGATLDLNEALLFGQWSSADCSCRHVTTRWRLHAHVNCPLMPYSYGGYGENNGVVWFDLVVQTRFDEHSGKLVLLEWYFDSAEVLRAVRRECRRRQYGGDWDWYEPDMTNWNEWEQYPPMCSAP